ncbi:MAG: hypothetical protein DHS20C05_25430 [Hyphococcus sp.]|nr:MAG: hypothetical protein DHS20C05_25430 [Marinicaulis sp.]
MLKRLIIARVFLVRALIVLAAFAQLVPMASAATTEDGDLKIVICMTDGPVTVDWAELTGEVSPYEANNEHEASGSCHACMACCRISAPAIFAGSSFPHTEFFPAPTPALNDAKSIKRAAVGPPLPSRAPPPAAV